MLFRSDYQHMHLEAHFQKRLGDNTIFGIECSHSVFPWSEKIYPLDVIKHNTVWNIPKLRNNKYLSFLIPDLSRIV